MVSSALKIAFHVVQLYLTNKIDICSSKKTKQKKIKQVK